jgi:hypothetical protein
MACADEALADKPGRAAGEDADAAGEGVEQVHARQRSGAMLPPALPLACGLHFLAAQPHQAQLLYARADESSAADRGGVSAAACRQTLFGCRGHYLLRFL